MYCIQSISLLFYRSERPKMMKSKLLFTISLLIVACSPIRGCVESEFNLAPDSRLPKWFSLSGGFSRDQVSVRLTYYTPPVAVDDTVLELVDRNGAILSKVTGQHCWHPVMNNKRNEYGGFTAKSYPLYVYVRANGLIEVIEHTPGAAFRITDDPVLVKQALGSDRCDKT
jgi:hypothetical protein